jgi:hypothetical protein
MTRREEGVRRDKREREREAGYGDRGREISRGVEKEEGCFFQFDLIRFCYFYLFTKMK